jgi:hypothetical protein
MNKRQKKKQLTHLVYPDKLPRKTIIRRLKFVGFSGYLSNNTGIQYKLTQFPTISFMLIRRAYRYNVNHNNLSRIFKYAEDALNYDFEWIDYIKGGK